MTLQEFNDNYTVEPVFEEFKVYFYVFKKEKVDYITPAIQISKDFDINSISNDVESQEIRKTADSFICKKYNIERK